MSTSGNQTSSTSGQQTAPPKQTKGKKLVIKWRQSANTLPISVFDDCSWTWNGYEGDFVDRQEVCTWWRLSKGMSGCVIEIDNFDDWWNGTGDWSDAAATGNSSDNATASTTKPEVCKYHQLEKTAEFDANVFSHRSVQQALDKALVDEQARLKRTLRAWPTCNYGGNVELGVSTGNNSIMSIGFLCSHCQRKAGY